MAYFPNGTSGMIYEEKWCARCIHRSVEDGTGCAIMLAHMVYNYDYAGNPHNPLNLLIPVGEDGFPLQCNLFIPGDPPPRKIPLKGTIATMPAANTGKVE